MRLVIEPRFIKIELGTQVWSIGNDEISVISVGKRRTKKKSMLLGGSHLYMAKAWPTGEISLWIERKPFGAQRLLGLRPVVGMDQAAIAGWAKLERLAAQLKRALSPYMAGASAFEMGRGGHRVFGLQYPEKVVVFARPIFREYPRRILEVSSEGTLVLPKRKSEDLRIDMHAGMEVIASGDRICFCRPDGQQTARLFLPWISSPDRVELTRRIQGLVGHAILSSEKPQRILPRGVELINSVSG